MKKQRGNSTSIRFHPEAPLTAEEIERLDRHRLTPVVRVASAQLCDWFFRLDVARRGEGDPPPAMVMGLLGGLGQGKSTVLHTVLREVETLRISRNLGCCLGTLRNKIRCRLQSTKRENPPFSPPEGESGGTNDEATVPHSICPRVHADTPSKTCLQYLRWFPCLCLFLVSAIKEGLQGVRPPRILRIDTSLSKAETIEQKLFSLLLFPHLAWGFARAAAALFFLMWAGFYLVGDVRSLFEIVNGVLGWSALAIIAVLLPLLVAVWAVGMELGKDWYGNFLDVLVFKAARFLLVTPELLVIDDLDRAKVEQQRAVLRTLYKHARMLDCAVVVCFDERELLVSKPDPDAPEELLRKVVNFAVRIPPRTKEDALLLATSICADWVWRNCETPSAAAVAAPLFAANLARAAWLLGQPGPRRIKDLLAQTVMMAATREAVSQEDLSALLRVMALFQVLPEAASDSEYLIRLLENNRKTAFEAYVNDLVTDPMRRKTGMRLLQRTRSLQPVKSGWRGLIGQEMNAADKPETSITLTKCLPALWQVKPSGKTENAVHARGFCLALSSELERIRNGYRPTHLGAVNAEVTVLKKFAGPVDEAALAPFILAATVEDSAEARLSLYQYWLSQLLQADDAAKAVCLPACLCEWVADEEVWARMSQAERQALLENAATGTSLDVINTMGLLVAPIEGDFPLLLRFVLKHCATEANKELAAALLRAAPVALQTKDMEGLDIPDDAPAVLGYAWPPLKPDEANPLASVYQPLQALGRFQRFTGNISFLPDGVYAGLKTHAPIKPEDWLQGIRGLLKPDDIWRLDYWHDTWRGNVPPTLKIWMARRFVPQEGLLEVNNEQFLTILALCIADEDWSGLRAILESSCNSIARLGSEFVLSKAIEQNADIVAAMATWSWFWFGYIPEQSVDTQSTLQAKLIESVLMFESGRQALAPLASEFLKRYEDIAAAETREIEMLPTMVPINPQEATKRRYIKGMYESYFRESGEDMRFGSGEGDVL